LQLEEGQFELLPVVFMTTEPISGPIFENNKGNTGIRFAAWFFPTAAGTL